MKILPIPKTVKEKKGRANLSAAISSDCELFAEALDSFRELSYRIHGIGLSDGVGGISFALDGSLALEEYRITVSESGATVYAATAIGAHRAAATLLQIMEGAPAGISLPLVEISDKPDKGYRTLMVDVARKWHPFDTLLNYIDLCYLYKIRYFHIHFIDSQSYTLPSERFPKMPTEGRHYTREEIRELNRYAKSRGVEIIPEMEVPGHAKAMVTAYPELFADDLVDENSVDTYSLFNATGKWNIICAGKLGIIDTVTELAKEIIEMFPDSEYLHIGGDEAKISDWDNCRECRRYMKEHSIDGVRALYTDFVKRVTDRVLELGKTPIVWEGFPREGAEKISRKVLVTAWESYYHLAPELLEEGFTITNASWQPLYAVPKGHRVVTEGRWSPSDIFSWNVYRWQNWNKKTAAYEKPIDVEPTDALLGATFCAWEDCYENDILAVKENLAAMSERVWNTEATSSPAELLECHARLTSLADKLLSNK